jgi:predicted transcriptional regulator
MSKGRSLKDLRNIHQLFGKQEQEGSFSEQLAAQEAATLVETFEDVEDCIINLMRNYRGWTAGEVHRALAKHPDAATIPALMNKFAHEGKFDIMASNRVSVYTLKRKPLETITSARSKAAAPFVLRDPEGTRKAADPMGVILVEDGVDVGIWKVMADFKPRTVYEIRAILNEYRFDRKQVDRRLDTLIRNNRWFDRSKRGGGDVVYTLKKHLPMPLVANGDPMLPAAFSGVKENLSEAAIKKLVPTAVDFSGHMAHSAGEMDRNVQAIAQAIEQERAEEKQEDAVHDAAAAEPEPVVEMPAADYTILADDSNAQAIWKAIHDHSWYTTPDIQLLVQVGKPDINVKAVATLLTKLWQDGMLERQPVEGKAYFNYRLVEGKPMPADNRLQHRLPKEQREAVSKIGKQSELPIEAAKAESAAPVVQEAPAQEPAAIVVQSQDNSINSQETDMTKATQAGAAPLVKINPTPAAPAVALLDTNIHIKGVAFTLLEADQLVDELVALGYSSTKVRALTMVNQTVEIKGTTFTMRELVELTDGLLKAGFGKDNVRA